MENIGIWRIKGAIAEPYFPPRDWSTLRARRSFGQIRAVTEIEEAEPMHTHYRGRRLWRFPLLAAFLMAAGPSFGQSHERQVTKLADGVYAIEHKHIPNADSGNTTVIIGDREVFVVDSGYFPSVAREDIAQIRQWTDKPVGYLLNTHFHNDHNNGNRTYLEAFPSLAIVAQEETKNEMDLIQPGNIERTPKEDAAAIAAYGKGKDTIGRALSDDEKKKSGNHPVLAAGGRGISANNLPASHAHI